METSVSVIVPVYSYGQYLKETLESIFSQSVQPHEVIVVSDGAIDNSVDIAKGFPVKLIEKENGGLASARNAGIAVATGKYITSVDSDDILRPDALKEHLKLADERSLVTCGLMAFGSENYTARPRKATIETLLKTNTIYSNTLFPRQAWIDVGGFDESETMRLGLEDWLFWTECLIAGYESKVSDYIALLWRRHQQAMSNVTANPNWEKIRSYMKEKMSTKYNLT